MRAVSDNPEWTKRDFAKAKAFDEVFPTMSKGRKFDVQDYLKTPDQQAAYLKAAFDSNDTSFIAAAIGDLAKARGVSKFSRETGLSREAIYKAFCVGGNPTLDTLTKATDVFGYKLTVVRKDRIVGSSAISHLSGQRTTAAKTKKRA
jgi:probable addiction module antidote protein